MHKAMGDANSLPRRCPAPRPTAAAELCLKRGGDVGMARSSLSVKDPFNRRAYAGRHDVFPRSNPDGRPVRGVAARVRYRFRRDARFHTGDRGVLRGGLRHALPSADQRYTEHELEAPLPARGRGRLLPRAVCERGGQPADPLRGLRAGRGQARRAQRTDVLVSAPAARPGIGEGHAGINRGGHRVTHVENGPCGPSHDPDYDSFGECGSQSHHWTYQLASPQRDRVALSGDEALGSLTYGRRPSPIAPSWRRGSPVSATSDPCTTASARSFRRRPVQPGVREDHPARPPQLGRPVGGVLGYL